ncbi:hypothetical protein NQ317_007247 [Molorchus minor]|uniref:Uncharacterized protein n=1 Tax=Molorchus minor TaxID=1323400 RepID=A0ABQ9JWG5_9CUCU|nr:hypothetical protein NQ317_007247 [Molorchus minor]
MYKLFTLVLITVSSAVENLQRPFQRVDSPPYLPSGWRPAGPRPQIQYGTPFKEYEPPQEATTTVETEVTTTEVPTTTEEITENNDDNSVINEDINQKLTQRGKKKKEFIIFIVLGVFFRKFVMQRMVVTRMWIIVQD